ncbi:MAG TPA: hypothetical protein VG820_07380 [Fimbriimonadaceae bacterium]|nr:hypothetical protein [Fimbriimonadaceae bacterium]
MKGRYILAVLVALLSMIAGAQRPRHPIPAVKGAGEDMQYGSALVAPPPDLKKALKLTLAQEKRMKAINAKYDAKMKASFEAHKNDPPDMERLRPIFEGRWHDLYAALSPKQKEALRKWVDTHHHHPHPGDPR